MNGETKKNPGQVIVIIIIIVILFSFINQCNNGGGNKSSNTCTYPDCNNSIYTFNLNGYCEKHRQEYEFYKAAKDLEKYADSIK